MKELVNSVSFFIFSTFFPFCLIFLWVSLSSLWIVPFSYLGGALQHLFLCIVCFSEFTFRDNVLNLMSQNVSISWVEYQSEPQKHRAVGEDFVLQRNSIYVNGLIFWFSSNDSSFQLTLEQLYCISPVKNWVYVCVHVYIHTYINS